MRTKEPPEISFRLWPPKLVAKGSEAICAVRKPLQLLLYAYAVLKTATVVVTLTMVIVVLFPCVSGENACSLSLITYLLR